MTSPSEPDRYSIDEMMERLKARQSGEGEPEGELVTRADGTQAVRVRKRKRRSHQPIHDERRSRRARMMQLSAALILLLLAVFAAGVAIVYANSSPFRNRLLTQITRRTGAEANLMQFRMNPAAANAGSLELRWPEGHPLKRLEGRIVRAEITPISFLGQSMTGQEVVAKEATLLLRVPEPAASTRHGDPDHGPDGIHFHRYAASKFNLLFGEQTLSTARLVESEASLTFSPSGTPQLQLVRGKLEVKGWPQMSLDRSLIEFRGTNAEVLSLRFSHDSDLRASMELSGSIAPFDPSRTCNLTARAVAFPLTGLAGPGIGNLFSGKIDTYPAADSNQLSFTPASGREPELTMTFRSTIASTFEIHHFPFLLGLSRGLDDEWFTRPSFESDVSGELHRTGSNVALRNLRCESKGRMALRGSIALDNANRLSGKLKIGVSDAMVKTALSPRLDSIMSPVEDGFRWLTVTVSGTASAPLDNFDELFRTAAPAPSARDQKPPVPSFEDLTAPE